MAWRYRRRHAVIPVCPECGAEAARTGQPGPLVRVRHFLVYGSPAPEIVRCVNGHDTRLGSWSATQFGRPLPRGLRLPIEVARAVHGNRTMQPVPLTYLMAAVLGSVVGVGTDLLLGWRWWLVALAFISATWLFFLSTAFWGIGGRQVGRAVRSAVNPRREHERDMDRVAEAVRSGMVSAFGVRGWRGPVVFGGWSSSNGNVTSITVGHTTDEEPKRSVVSVGFHTDNTPLEVVREQVVEELVFNAVPLPNPDDSAAEDLHTRMVQRRFAAKQGPRPHPTERTVSVDGELRMFHVFEAAGQIAAVADHAGGTLTIQGPLEVIDTLELERLDDIDPLLAARRGLLG